ncbi:MAG: PadR family transcriptional regulator [Clostridia bacterium]|nr:PadR family transcriptional regulator [Clostridia bacterium]
MSKRKTDSSSATGIAENMKKGITEMLILAFLNQEEATINSIVKKLDECSDGKCKITFPYATIYRLLDNAYIAESEKRVADNRRRQFYKITDKGRKYFAQMRSEYMNFISGVDMIFDYIDAEE